MKNLILVVMAIFLVDSVGVLAQPGTETNEVNGVKFSDVSWEQARFIARNENKLVFLDAYASWCGPCKWMDKNVFPAEEAGKFFNGNFINVKMDMEKGEGVALAKKYDVHAFPSYLFINNDGEVAHKIVGSRELKDFLAASEKALSIHTQYSTLVKKFDAAHYLPEDLFVMAHTFQEAGDDARAGSAADLYLKAQKDLLKEENLKFIYDFTNSVDQTGFVLMREYPDAFKKLKGDTVYNDRLYDLVYRDAATHVKLPKTISKDECEKYIKAGKEYFQKTLPLQEPRLASNFAIKIYSMAGDIDKFAAATIRHYKNYPPRDYNQLNSLAWNFYEKVNNKEQLKVAIGWALESVRLRAQYANLDTVANLYLKVGNKERAKDYAIKAIAKGREAGEDTSSTEKMLLSL
jgi:thiol-disulfide isomerase/thioredoxin